MADRTTTFTGRPRSKRTRSTVRLADRLAGGLITVGGIGTIVAVCGVCLYLVWMVVPLFKPADLDAPAAVARSPLSGEVLALRVGEAGQVGWALDGDGRLTVFRPGTGDAIRTADLLAGGARPTAVSAPLDGDMLAVGLADGTVRLGTAKIETAFLNTSAAAPELRKLRPGETAVTGESVVVRIGQGQLRSESVAIEFTGDPIRVSTGSAIRRLDHVETGSGPILLAWSDDGKARLVTVGRSENVFSGEVELSAGTTATLPARNVPTGPPRFVRLGARGVTTYLAWPDGATFRFATRPGSAAFVERVDLTDAELTGLEFLVGRISLLAGDSAGNVSAWFPARPDVPNEATARQEPGSGGGTGGGAAADPAKPPAAEDAEKSVSSDNPLVKAHDLGRGPAAVTALAPAPRSRVAAAGFADGTIRVVQTTTETELASARLPGEKPAAVSRLLLPAGDQGTMYAVAGDRLYRAAVDAGYPEAGLASFFRPVWYESYPGSKHVWQSSAGTNAAEPKFGLVPLVFGTLKATVYSMLFGVPLALLAAIYTSEFLSKRTRARVKPVIEVMASLPSVVLGFLAAIVFAPIVRDWLPSVIASAVTVPLALLTAAHLWQLLPSDVLRKWERLRLPLAGMTVLAGLGLAAVVGPWIEWALFAGDVERWLAGQIGSGFGAWMLLWLPVSAFALAYASGRYLNPLLLAWSAGLGSDDRGRALAASVDLLRFVALMLAAALLAAAVSGLLTLAGLDPRGSYVGTYVQRNAMVVGFVMGFAIIPIIYTLADDALNAVPDSLRSASLGSGATQWQTALRVVIPTATSGLFSAIMVGLGRAVGETMIVLMAAGNTPIMDWNLFNGFQTLSAAIATEMSESVRNSTHFRTLFLAALVLFAMTFVVNTVAEMVRLRFRKRVVQL